MGSFLRFLRLCSLYEQALRPVPQENCSPVEQAGEPVAENATTYDIAPYDVLNSHSKRCG